MESTNSDPRAATPAAPQPSRAAYGGQRLDPTPPGDHAGFLEARSLGLKAMREKLAGRRKRR
jgi:hypothetical protein